MRHFDGWWSGERREALKNAANDIFVRAEAAGKFPRCAPFERDYHDDYPALGELELGYARVRDECLALLDRRDEFTDVSALGGSYTAGGIHTIRWKSYLLKSGEFVPENCARAPATTALLAQIPGLYTAFFSVLEPRQRIAPHWGYWKGFVRYHLGVWIPRDNADRSSWLRVNADPRDNAARDPALVERGERYYWHNGEGVLFDDTFLHDAANDSDEVRVVLWLDLRRRMPLYLEALNAAFLELAHREPSVVKIRENGVVRFSAPTRRA